MSGDQFARESVMRATWRAHRHIRRQRAPTQRICRWRIPERENFAERNPGVSPADLVRAHRRVVPRQARHIRRGDPTLATIQPSNDDAGRRRLGRRGRAMGVRDKGRCVECRQHERGSDGKPAGHLYVSWSFGCRGCTPARTGRRHPRHPRARPVCRTRCERPRAPCCVRRRPPCARRR